MSDDPRIAKLLSRREACRLIKHPLTNDYLNEQALLEVSKFQRLGWLRRKVK
jgi:hypothetical protein